MPTKPLKLFWWRPNSSDQINLGDEINKAIVEAVSGRPVLRTRIENCDLLAIGSVLGFPERQNAFDKRTSPIHVWGSGIVKPETPEGNFVFSAVRGPLTHYFVGQPKGTPMGDPGLLVPDLWRKSTERRYRLGIVPHHTQVNDPLVLELAGSLERSVLIDFTNPDIEGTLRTLSACEGIVSSSLHGLIIADAYGIPNVWLSINKKRPKWKFYDYLASVGRRNFEPFSPVPGSRHTLEDEDFELASQDRIKEMTQSLRKSFPAQI